MRRTFTVLVALTLVLAVGCGGGGEKDLTNREITDDELALMVLPQSELGPEYADFELDESSGLQTNEQAISDAFDVEDEAQDVERFGRANGYETFYTSSQALLTEEGPVNVGTAVVLHEDADGASGNLQDGADDAQRAVGKTSEDVTVESAEAFEVSGIGQDAVGVVQKASFTADQAEFTLSVTVVGFQEGRLIGSVVITGFEGEDMQAEATDLARKLDERILAVLRGEVEQAEAAATSEARPAPTSEATPEATSEPVSERTAAPGAAVSASDVLDSFRFSGEMAVEIADGGLALTMEGAFEGPDRLECTMNASLGGLEVSGDKLVVIGENAWLDTGDGFDATSADGSDVVDDLGLCPGSPLFWEGFDFLQDAGPVSGQPDTVNGVAATKYALGEAAATLESIGFLPTELEGMTIETFDVWVAEDGGWPVALDIDITADAQAAADTFGVPLEEGAQEARITVRVDITDVNAGDIHVDEPAP